MEPKFKVGDRVTYLSRKEVEEKYNRDGYFYGGSCQGGFVGTIKCIEGFDSNRGAYKYLVTAKHSDSYIMSEKEFVEYDSVVSKRTFNTANIELLKKGLVTIKTNNYDVYPGGIYEFITKINEILQEAGLDPFGSGSTWKYVYKYELDNDTNRQIGYCDTVDEIPSRRRRKHLTIDDFYTYETQPQVVSVNYDIY